MKVSAAQCLLWVGGAIAVSVIVAWTLVWAHASQPHAGAITRHELSLLRKQVDSGFADLKNDIRELRQELSGR